MSQSWPSITSADDVDIDKILARLDALRSMFSGTARPSSPVAGQVFFDTDSGPILEICTNPTGPVWAGLATVLAASDLLDKIKTVDGAGSGLDADLLDGQSSAYFLAASAYTAADVLSKLLTVDGSGSGLDADLLEGQSSAYFLAFSNFTGTASSAQIADAAITLAKQANVATGTLFYRKTAGAGAPEVQTLATLKTDLGLTGTNSGDQTITLTGDVTGSGTGSFAATLVAASVLAKLLTVDGAGSLLDADLLDGQEGTYYRNASNLNAGTVPAAQMPALSGDVTSVAGAVATTLAAAAVTGKTADAAPDMSADYVLTYDNSAAALKKVLLQYIGAGKQAVYIPASAMAPRNTNPCAAVATLETTSNKQNYDHLAFDATTQEFAVFAWRAPKQIATSTFTAIFDWSHPATTTNFGVVWGLSAAGRGDGDALDVAMGTAVTATDTGGTTDTMYVSPVSGTLTVGGTFAAEDVIRFQVSRNPADGSDTMAVDARLHGIWLIFTTTQNTEQ